MGMTDSRSSRITSLLLLRLRSSVPSIWARKLDGTARIEFAEQRFDFWGSAEEDTIRGMSMAVETMGELTHRRRP
ncbi:hypothetical protein BHE74_00036521 [Ensete ventricosum]|nr:hypothetical protein BHE74_00036521 [Ensete ventricosum]